MYVLYLEEHVKNIDPRTVNCLFRLTSLSQIAMIFILLEFHYFILFYLKSKQRELRM